MSDSIFKKSISSFFVSLFAAVGVLIGLAIAVFAIALFVSYAEEDSFSSNVKIMPDANFSRKELPKGTPTLLQINVKGEIGNEELKASKIQNVLLRSREDDFKDDRIKGILLVIDSPGGDANDSDIIYRMLKEYKERFKIPIYAYIDGICASGSFYLACAADKIYASEVALIGSVGVISWPPFLNFVDLMQKLGVSTKTLSAGLDKDQMNPFRPWKEGEEKNHRVILDFYYNRFVEVVTANRPLAREKLVDSYGAKVFPAPLAKEQGYIDFDHAKLSDAINGLLNAAGLKEDEKYQVVCLESTEWFKKLWKGRSFFKIELPEEFKLVHDRPVKYLYNP